MMIYNDSTKGISIHVNMPKVTPAMIAEAESRPDRRLTIECVAPTAPAPEGIKCPNCKEGTLQCVRDASVTRAVVDAIRKTIPSSVAGRETYSYAEAVLADEEDVNTYDDYRLCCNDCDGTFSDEEVYALIHEAPEPSGEDLTQCQNCRRIRPEAELNEFVFSAERVAPGEPLPIGECPDCGAVCHPVKK